MDVRLSPRGVLTGALALALSLQCSSPLAYAQVAFGTLVGNVTDQSGAAVPSATIKATLTSTNDVRNSVADAAGAFTISTVTPGTYKIEISAQGFRTFLAPEILVNQNNIVRVDAQLQVGATSEAVTVEATTAALQTDRTDIRGELAAKQLMELPQPNRTYLGMLVLMTGTTPPGGQLSGGTNNPSKGMTFAFNGTGNNGATVRIEGVNALNPWNRSAQSYVPSIEAIQNVNVATNANDAEQAMAGGASVNVMLKSGTNQLHGSVFWYNSNSFSEANNFFANQRGLKPPPLNNNNAGGSMGGYIIKNKLFYFGSYEGDFNHSSDSAILSIPGPVELGGDFRGSANPIYDPLTGVVGNCLAGGNAAQCATDRTPFADNIIPKSRFDAVTNRIIPDIPKTNFAGSINNYYMNRLTIYNLHKIDTKFDYNATSKLRLSFRYGKQPYYNFQQPIYGEVLGGSAGFPQSGAGNYLQHGHGVTLSGSANYVASPSLVIDGTWGYVKSHQLLFPNKYQEKYGLDTLKIPGSNQGPLPWAGGVPNFRISGGYVPIGMSYPALEYMQPLYEYVANVSKIKGAHSIRAGFDAFYQFPDHIEIRDNSYFFDGSSTIRNGGPGANNYNAMADFVLGRHNNAYQWIQVLQPFLKMRWWQYAFYVRDQWQVNRKLTLNYGVRWEKYPIPNRVDTGIYFADYFNSFTVSVCGEGNQPRNCGMTTSNKLFAPNFGIAYRPTEKVVLRAGYSLSPNQEPMGTGQMQAFPGEVRLDLQPFNATYGSGGTLSQGFPIIQAPKGDNGVYKIPAQTGNLTAINIQNNYVRGYFQSYNITAQKEFGGDIVAQVGYVGMHAVKLQRSLNVNYGQVGGGNASLPLFKFGHTTNATGLFFDGASKYNSLQSTITKRLSKGFTSQLAYTYSKLITMNAQILIPQYKQRNYYTDGADRTHHIALSANYMLPFGKGQAWVKQGIGAAILGDWNLSALYNHWSGVPFTVTASGASCNCPNNTQTADQVKSNVSVGTLRGTAVASNNPNDAYFDVLAYRPVTDVRFGTSGFNQLRGPGNDNIDMSLMKMVRITERWGFQIRGEALNLTNTAHFAVPGANVSNMSLNADGSVRALNGFGQITATAPLGRIIDQRFFRFSLRLLW